MNPTMVLRKAVWRKLWSTRAPAATPVEQTPANPTTSPTTTSPANTSPATADAPTAEAQESPPYGTLLVVWMVALLLANGLLWVSGARGAALGFAVETGTARVESQTSGEASTDVIRKAIQMQRDTLPFWATLQLVGDLLVAPAMLGLRAVAICSLFSAWAAIRGRPTRFGRAMQQSVLWQGVWVLSAVTQLVLTWLWQGSEVDTSLALFLPPGAYPATVWMLLKQIDLFALIGWSALAYGGWQRGQAGMFMASLLTGMLFLFEIMFASSFNLLLGSAMRVALMPQ